MRASSFPNYMYSLNHLDDVPVLFKPENNKTETLYHLLTCLVDEFMDHNQVMFSSGVLGISIDGCKIPYQLIGDGFRLQSKLYFR